MYVNSPGGSVTAGMAIFDTMRHIRPDVSTVCVGLAARYFQLSLVDRESTFSTLLWLSSCSKSMAQAARLRCPFLLSYSNFFIHKGGPPCSCTIQLLAHTETYCEALLQALTSAFARQCPCVWLCSMGAFLLSAGTKGEWSSWPRSWNPLLGGLCTIQPYPVGMPHPACSPCGWPRRSPSSDRFTRAGAWLTPHDASLG